MQDILIAKLAAASCVLAGLPVLEEPKPGNVGIGMLYSVPYLLAAFAPGISRELPVMMRSCTNAPDECDGKG